MRRESVVDLYRGDPRASSEKRTRQNAQPRPDLQHVRADRRFGERHDVVDHVAIDEVVLRAAFPRGKAVATQVALDALSRKSARIELVDGAWLGHAASATASLSDGLAARSARARIPARARKNPAAPIIAALSVHRPGRGTRTRIPRFSPACLMRARRTALAATPPPTTIVRAPISSAAR